MTGPREGTLAPHAPAESESMAHLRKDKVARLRRAIKNGSFRVDVDRLVDEMLGL
ncbi:MAG: flagellar biosynthesis anti-sigma factor FlgM [Proteobacteria bacterium]|nr:flagellar biosynthesis anti-sigma factor FlgM [Pseudomonadota bacterium]